MNKRKNKYCFFLGATLASFIFVLQPTVYVVFAGDPPNDAVAYIFTSIDIPTSRGEFGFTSLDDINDKGESVGGFVAGPVGFLLDEKTKFTEIECPGAIDSTAPKAINNRTEISGFCFVGGKIHLAVAHVDDLRSVRKYCGGVGCHEMLAFPDAD